MSEHRALGRAHARLLLRSLPLVVALVGLTTVLAQPAQAAGETLTVSQTSNLTDGQTVNVTVKTTAATNDDVFLAVTQCGNATAAGAGISSLDTLGKDCASTEAGALNTYVKLIGTGGTPGVPAGPVPAGTYNLTLKLKKTGIGPNNRQCLPVGGSVTLPCTIAAAASTATAGAAVPGYSFQLSQDITFASGTTTTTTSTTTSSTSTSSTSTTSTSSTSSTSTTSTSSVSSSSTTSTTSASRTALTLKPTSTASEATGAAGTTTTTTTKPSSALAFTGSTRTNLFVAFVGLALLDLGYLALSATRPGGRRRLPRLRRGG